jgi:hypothetical protein
MASPILTQEQLKMLLNYDPETGVFTWRKTGRNATTVRPDGYVKITVNGRQCYAHRLAWLYMTDTLPAIIDHIDRNPSNNKFNNLRAVTRSQNQHNRIKQRNNTSGYKGVVFFKRAKRWRAAIFVNSKPIYLGYYDTPEQASAAYQEAASKYHTHRPKT